MSTSAAWSAAVAAPDETAASTSARRLAEAPRREFQPPRAPFVGLVVGMLAAALLGLLLMNTQIARNSFTVSRLQAKNATLDMQQQRLQAQVDGNAAPNTLAARAAKLGMVPAGQPAFIRLPDGKVLGVPKPAVTPKPIRIRGVGPLAHAASAGRPSSLPPSPSPSPSPSTSTSTSPSAAPGIAPTSAAGGTR